MKKIFLFISFLILPISLFSASRASFSDIIDAGFRIINSTLIPMAFALCLAYFFWGMAKYIRDGASSDKASEEGKHIMIRGVLGIFVAFSIWGIIMFIKGEFGLSSDDNSFIINIQQRQK